MFDTDEKLMKKVQTGMGDPSIFNGASFLYIDGIFAKTVPAVVTQRDFVSLNAIGANNIEKAKAA